MISIDVKVKTSEDKQKIPGPYRKVRYTKKAVPDKRNGLEIFLNSLNS